MMPHKIDRKHLVKYLEDDGLYIEPKKDEREGQKKQPPKLRGKHFANLEYLADADLVWLTPDHTKSFPSITYNESMDDSYFEQCFIVMGKLGEGSFGTVLKTICKDDSKFYAIKVSKEPFRNDTDKIHKIREVEYHKSFSNHPNIVTLHVAWEEDRHLYMQLELCKNNLVISKAMPENICWNVLADIVSALDYMHESGMGHFDVKPENILLGFDGLYKLSDFGLVYSFQEDKKTIPSEGDAKYLPPELLASKYNFTSKADIFSLGISILELAGNLHLPANGEVWTALRENKFPFAQTKHLSTELFLLIRKMMSSDYTLRPSTKEILKMPTVMALVDKRKYMHLQNVNYPLTQDKFLPYMATWAVFSTLVQGIAKEIKPVKECENEANMMKRCGELTATFVTSTPMDEDVNNRNTAPTGVVPNGAFHWNTTSAPGADQNQHEMVVDVPENIYPTPSSSFSNEWVSQHVLRNSAQKVCSPDHRPESPVSCFVPSSSSLRALDFDNFRLPSQVAVQFGVSPIRLSHELKQKLREKKIQKRKKIDRTKRSLLNSFESMGETVDNVDRQERFESIGMPGEFKNIDSSDTEATSYQSSSDEQSVEYKFNEIIVLKRRKRMSPKNLNERFDDEEFM